VLVDFAHDHVTPREPPDPPSPASAAMALDPSRQLLGPGCVLPSVIGKTHLVISV